MAITSTGLGSGLDIAGIVSKLISVEAQPLSLLDTKEASYQAQLTGYGTFSGALSSFQSAAAALNNASNIGTISAGSSNAAVISATASSTATQGNYSLQVTQLATNQQLFANGVTSTTTPIGTGTISFDFGTISGGTLTAGQYSGATFTSNGNGIKSVTINASNNSLTGIVAAINAANIGVNASIVNDGSGTPYRLSITSVNTGVSNSLKISTSLPGGGLDNLIAYDPAATQNLTQTVAAQNSTLTVNGLATTQASNTVTGVIPGVTLNLLNTSSGVPINVTVGQSSAGFVTAMNSFVTQYNALVSSVTTLTGYNAKTKQAGLLSGNASILGIMAKIKSTLNSNVTGIAGSNSATSPGVFTSIAQIGLTFSKDGSLALDSSKLSSALASSPKGVAALFATIGIPSDSLVSYVSSTSSTIAANQPLVITQIASKGQANGSAAVGSNTITAGVNDTLTVTINGVTSTITIPAGSYTLSGLESTIQAAINGNNAYSSAGVSVAVTDTAGVLNITSNNYGSSSSVVINGGNASLNLFGAGPTTTAGTDVAGTLNGVTATGSGQTLKGIDGLQITVNGGALGNRGTVQFTQGYGALLNTYTSGLLASGGALQADTDGVNASIASIDKQRSTFNARLLTDQANLLAEFNAMDVLVGQLKQTSSFLTQQFAALNASSSSSSSAA
ncbi:MAG TPA: flagellar filament capping protein FliD [Methylophilaceae bacterium]|jgi:flagellar hook-associated protein 2